MTERSGNKTKSPQGAQNKLKQPDELSEQDLNKVAGGAGPVDGVKLNVGPVDGVKLNIGPVDGRR